MVELIFGGCGFESHRSRSFWCSRASMIKIDKAERNTITQKKRLLTIHLPITLTLCWSIHTYLLHFCKQGMESARHFPVQQRTWKTQRHQSRLTCQRTRSPSPASNTAPPKSMMWIFVVSAHVWRATETRYKCIVQCEFYQKMSGEKP